MSNPRKAADSDILATLKAMSALSTQVALLHEDENEISGIINLINKTVDPATRQILTRTRSADVVTSHNPFPDPDPERLAKVAALPRLEDKFKRHLAFETTKQAFALKLKEAFEQVDLSVVQALLGSAEGRVIAAAVTILTDLIPASGSNPLIFSLVGVDYYYEFTTAETEIKRYEMLCFLLEAVKQNDRSLRISKNILRSIATGLGELEEGARTPKITEVALACQQKANEIEQRQKVGVNVKSLR